MLIEDAKGQLGEGRQTGKTEDHISLLKMEVCCAHHLIDIRYPFFVVVVFTSIIKSSTLVISSVNPNPASGGAYKTIRADKHHKLLARCLRHHFLYL